MFGTLDRFTKFAWLSVAYNTFVILWGAWVRITGSGAGCGEHWPTCKGEITPSELSSSVATLIEFTHRITSSLCLVFAIILVVWARRLHAKGHRVRKAAWTALAFLIMEALLGAVLVKYSLVNQNDSVARAIIVALHLMNTLMLVGFGALTAWWGGGGAPLEWSKASTGRRGFLIVVIVLMFITCMAGAVTALGDTLFPIDPQAGSGLWDRIQGDLSSTEHFLIRLRIAHPVLAVGTGLFLLGWTTALRFDDQKKSVLQWSYAVTAMVLIEIFVGFLNIYLAAPGWIQLIHLFLADALWISVLLLCAALLGGEHEVEEHPHLSA